MTTNGGFMSIFGKLHSLLRIKQKKVSAVDEALANIQSLSSTDWNSIYSSDFKNITIRAYYKDVGVYCKALRYILECFEAHRAVSVYYVNSAVQEVYLPEWFLMDGNFLSDVNGTARDFLNMAYLFLEQYQEMESNVSSTEQLTVERNLQLTRVLVGDLVNLAGQFKHFMV